MHRSFCKIRRRMGDSRERNQQFRRSRRREVGNHRLFCKTHRRRVGAPKSACARRKKKDPESILLDWGRGTLKQSLCAPAPVWARWLAVRALSGHVPRLPAVIEFSYPLLFFLPFSCHVHTDQKVSL